MEGYVDAEASEPMAVGVAEPFEAKQATDNPEASCRADKRVWR